jgi:hypothetical protein
VCVRRADIVGDYLSFDVIRLSSQPKLVTAAYCGIVISLAVSAVAIGVKARDRLARAVRTGHVSLRLVRLLLWRDISVSAHAYVCGYACRHACMCAGRGWRWLQVRLVVWRLRRRSHIRRQARTRAHMHTRKGAHARTTTCAH